MLVEAVRMCSWQKKCKSLRGKTDCKFGLKHRASRALSAVVAFRGRKWRSCLHTRHHISTSVRLRGSSAEAASRLRTDRGLRGHKLRVLILYQLTKPPPALTSRAHLALQATTMNITTTSRCTVHECVQPTNCRTSAWNPGTSWGG
jgi:hypothetical protein